MTALILFTIGKMKDGPEAQLCAEYLKRLRGHIDIKEIVVPAKGGADARARESAALLAALPEKAFLVALDERGKNFSSAEFSEKLAAWQGRGPPVCFAIGGADGHDESLRKRADARLAFGPQTWPHKLVRVMLLEQIYRAVSISAGHPYHRA